MVEETEIQNAVHLGVGVKHILYSIVFCECYRGVIIVIVDIEDIHCCMSGSP